MSVGPSRGVGPAAAAPAGPSACGIVNFALLYGGRLIGPDVERARVFAPASPCDTA